MSRAWQRRRWLASWGTCGPRGVREHDGETGPLPVVRMPVFCGSSDGSSALRGSAHSAAQRLVFLWWPLASPGVPWCPLVPSSCGATCSLLRRNLEGTGSL